MWFLIDSEGSRALKPGLKFTIGRFQCDLCFRSDRTISKSQVSLVPNQTNPLDLNEKESITVCDESGKSTTLVDSEPITGSKTLTSSFQLSFGRNGNGVKVVFCYIEIVGNIQSNLGFKTSLFQTKTSTHVLVDDPFSYTVLQARTTDISFCSREWIQTLEHGVSPGDLKEPTLKNLLQGINICVEDVDLQELCRKLGAKIILPNAPKVFPLLCIQDDPKVPLLSTHLTKQQLITGIQKGIPNFWQHKVKSTTATPKKSPFLSFNSLSKLFERSSSLDFGKRPGSPLEKVQKIRRLEFVEELDVPEEQEMEVQEHEQMQVEDVMQQEVVSLVKNKTTKIDEYYPPCFREKNNFKHFKSKRPVMTTIIDVD